MAKPPPKNRQPLNIFLDEQLGPEGLADAFAAATHDETVIAMQPAAASPPLKPFRPAASSVPADEMLQGRANSRSDSGQTASSVPEVKGEPLRASQLKSTPAPLERNVPFEIRIPQLTKGEFMSFKARLGAALGGVPLTDSHIVRALFECLLVQYADFVVEVAGEQPRPIKRPANQDLIAQAEFDALLAGIFREGHQRARRRRPARVDDEASA